MIPENKKINDLVGQFGGLKLNLILDLKKSEAEEKEKEKLQENWKEQAKEIKLMKEEEEIKKLREEIVKSYPEFENIFEESSLSEKKKVANSIDGDKYAGFMSKFSDGDSLWLELHQKTKKVLHYYLKQEYTVTGDKSWVEDTMAESSTSESVPSFSGSEKSNEFSNEVKSETSSEDDELNRKKLKEILDKKDTSSESSSGTKTSSNSSDLD